MANIKTKLVNGVRMPLNENELLEIEQREIESSTPVPEEEIQKAKQREVDSIAHNLPLGLILHYLVLLAKDTGRIPSDATEAEAIDLIKQDMVGHLDCDTSRPFPVVKLKK